MYRQTDWFYGRLNNRSIKPLQVESKYTSLGYKKIGYSLLLFLWILGKQYQNYLVHKTF